MISGYLLEKKMQAKILILELNSFSKFYLLICQNSSVNLLPMFRVPVLLFGRAMVWFYSPPSIHSRYPAEECCSVEARIGVLDDAATAVLAHNAVAVHSHPRAVLQAELLQAPAEVGQGLQASVSDQVT